MADEIAKPVTRGEVFASPSEDSHVSPRALDTRRILLRDELARRSSPQIAAMYWQAVRALDDRGNGERYVIAGHLLRETQDQLPRHLDVPDAAPRMRLGQVFQWLKGRWNRLIGSTASCGTDGRWAGSVDGPLAKFLWDLNKKMAQYEADRPRTVDVQRRTLATIDPALAAVPDAAARDVVAAWLRFHDVFTSAAHHGTVDAPDFERAVEGFEDLLGDRLVPRTFEKQDEIARRVREIEARADH